jgi:hypothetical protein
MSLRNLILASMLLLSTAPFALAGSVTQPGDTMGVANGASTPVGFYFVNQANWGCSNTTPRTCLTAEVPLLVWSTPWKILGGQLLLTTGPTTVVHVDIDQVDERTGLFNPFVGGKLTWDLGNGWGFGYMLGTYFDINSNVAYSSSSLNQRFALSYTANEWNLTANAIWGINFDQSTNDPQGTPCPGSPSFGCNPNFLNVDLTATKRFGKWEAGAIGFYATDISTPISGYDKQSKAAIGGLVGYSFGPFILQIYATTEVYENNYGGKDTRLWSRITIPLGSPGPGHRAIAP